MAPRHLFIAVLVVALGLLALFAPEDEIAQPTRKAGGAAQHARSPQPVEKPRAAPDANVAVRPGEQSLRSRARSVPENVPDLFKAFSWYVPPPPSPPAPPPPPPPPEAPPLPFAYMGQYIEGDHQLLLLTRGNRVLTVAVGEVIANTYRVESVSGKEIVFTYLPLNMTQTLRADTN